MCEEKANLRSRLGLKSIFTSAENEDTLYLIKNACKRDFTKYFLSF